MYITLDPPCRQAFLTALRPSVPAVDPALSGCVMELDGIAPEQAAPALAGGAFPVYEKSLLEMLARRGFTFFDQEERKKLLTLARQRAAEDVYHGTPASGPGRLRRLEELFRQELADTGRLHLAGFCRFRLQGHRSYLRYLLEISAAELLAQKEDDEFLSLLRQQAEPGPKSREWQLEFLPGGAYILKNGRLEEGGRWPGREEVLIAELISRRPRRVHMTGLSYAPPGVTSCLEQALGNRLYYHPPEKLDKGSDKC